MYDSGPSDEELKAIGLEREDIADNSNFEVWPENWEPFLVFSEVSTQWRVSMNGPSGLDYNVAFKFMDLMKIGESKQLKTIRAIRVMESSALKQMAKK